MSEENYLTICSAMKHFFATQSLRVHGRYSENIFLDN